MTDSQTPTLFARFVAKEDGFEELRNRMAKLVPAAAEEEGVVSYRMHADPDQGSIWFYEAFADAEAESVHRESTILRGTIEECRPWIEHSEVVQGLIIDQKPDGGDHR